MVYRTKNEKKYDRLLSLIKGDFSQDVDFIHIPDEDSLKSNFKNLDALVCYGIKKENFDYRSDKLKWIHIGASGVDGNLFTELIKSKVMITNAKGINAKPVAEFIMSQILYFSKQLYSCETFKQDRVWNQWELAKNTLQLSDLTLGIIGYGEIGKEKPGILGQDGKIRDLSNHITDINGDNISEEGLNKISMIDVSSLPIIPENTRLGACVGNIGKFLCIGLNYSDHAAETGMPVPSEPILFSKATSAVVGPNDNVEIPRNSNETDWEVELGIIIGKKAKYINEEDAEEYIAGYCVVNDVSEREFQLKKEGQWTKGKSCDTFGPTGPYLVTKDEVSDVQNLKMYLDVNGKRMQDGSTKTMIFSAKYIVYYLSQFMSLNPGDIIATGTPPGVGGGMKPPVFLKAGDKMKLGIEGLGEQNQTCFQG